MIDCATFTVNKPCLIVHSENYISRISTYISDVVFDIITRYLHFSV